jgi:hypothetical protein
MSSTTLRIVIAIVLFVHAVGHGQGVLAALGVFSSENWNARSWLFDNLLGEKGSRAVALVLWAASFLGFLAAGFAFLGIGIPHDMWRTLALIFVIPSVLGLVFYWHSLAQFFNKVGAIGVNAAIVIGLLILHWPTEADIGF